MLLALLLACRCSAPDAPQEISFPSPVLRQVGGRFRGEPDTPLDPQVAFEVQGRCPRVERVTFRRVNETFHEAVVEGQGLDGVTRVSAALATGKLANAQFLRRGDTLVFPLACDDCEVYLGVKAGDRTAACLGPGYSFWVRGGRVEP